MAGEALLINPRHRRRRRKKAARSHRKSRRRRVRRNPFTMNPRRRRRRVHARRARRRGHRRRIHRNPRLPLIGSVNLTAIGGGAAGFVATKYATPWLLGMLPAAWSADPNTAPLVRIGAKAVVGLALIPMALRFIPGARKFAGPAAIGAGIAVAVDLFETYVAPRLGLSDYEMARLSEYETRQLSDVADPYGIGGTGAFGNSAYAGSGAY